MLGHDWSISDDPKCYDRIDRLGLSTITTIDIPDLVRSDTCRYVQVRVHYEPVRSVVIGYEFALNYCPDHDKR